MTKFDDGHRKPVSFYSHYDHPGHGTMIHLLQGAGMTWVKNPEDADILVFNGGADIGTEIYSEAPVFRGIPAFRSKRDNEEIDLFNEFKGRKFLLGICRGAQLLNCLNGGSLWQHVDNHGMDHQMIDLASGKVYQTTSTHHQMMRPTKAAELIAVASQARNKFAEATTRNDIARTADLKRGEDIEIVWYKDTQSLCIQGHPEYVPGSQFAEYCLRLVDTHMKVAA